MQTVLSACLLALCVAPPAPLVPPQEAQTDNPILGWFDRHYLLIQRDLAFRTDFEILLPSPGANNRMTGSLAFADVRHYEMNLVNDGQDPRTGQRRKLSVRFLAEGSRLWSITTLPAPSREMVESTNLELLTAKKMRRMELGQPVAGLDPLDLIFDYRAVRNAFVFEPLGSREIGGRPVVVFRGQLVPPADLSAQERQFLKSGAQNCEIAFDARTGLIVMYELRTSERILTRTVLKDLEFDKSIRPGRFHYAPPEGVSVLDHDAAIVRELNRP